MQEFITVANFKSNKISSSISAWLDEVSSSPQTKSLKILLALPFPYFHLIESDSPFVPCAQDVSPFPQGSYTGAVNASQLKDCSAKYCLIGHSERRRYFHETDLDVANKANELLVNDITPLIFLDSPYISSQISALSPDVIPASIFVYEPAEDIGGTEAANNQEIESNLLQIKQKTGSSNPILYGGSANSDNIRTLMETGIGGVVAATASQNSQSFINLLSEISRNA